MWSFKAECSLHALFTPLPVAWKSLYRKHTTLPLFISFFMSSFFLSFSRMRCDHSSVKCLTRSLHALFTPLSVAWKSLYRKHTTLPLFISFFMSSFFLSFSRMRCDHSRVKCLTRSLHALFTPLPVAWKSLYRKHTTLTYNTKESVRLLCENNLTGLRSTLFALVLNNWMSPLAQFIKPIAK